MICCLHLPSKVSTMQEWFENWFDSPYYHQLYRDRSEQEASGFVDMLVSHFSMQQGITLLDLACGKGRHSLAFAAHGLDVTGVDLSRQSIEYAAQFERDNLHFYVHDMREVFRANYFDVVCNLFTSFGYFNTSHDHQLAARSIVQALKPGGSFIIDFVNRIPAIRNIEANPRETIVRDTVRFEVERSHSATRLLKKIRVSDGGKEYQFEESVSSFTRDEMTALFSSAGLHYRQAFGNYQLGEYDEAASPRMILHFTK